MHEDLTVRDAKLAFDRINGIGFCTDSRMTSGCQGQCHLRPTHAGRHG
jgi:hypothetical protein